jgi:hypothetical protein
MTSTIAAGTLRGGAVVAMDGRRDPLDGRQRALKVLGADADGESRVAHGRAARRTRGTPMKFRIYQHALTVMLAAYTLVHTLGAKWG